MLGQEVLGWALSLDAEGQRPRKSPRLKGSRKEPSGFGAAYLFDGCSFAFVAAEDVVAPAAWPGAAVASEVQAGAQIGGVQAGVQAPPPLLLPVETHCGLQTIGTSSSLTPLLEILRTNLAHTSSQCSSHHGRLDSAAPAASQ